LSVKQNYTHVAAREYKICVKSCW